ncbi:MAG: extensin family protein [Pseudomonadota bacterium]
MGFLQLLGRAVLTAVVLALVLLALHVHPQTPLPDAWNVARPLDPRAAPTPVTNWKLRRATAAPSACRAALSRGGATFQDEAPREADGPCGISDRVTLTGLSKAMLDPLETRCGIALRLLMWEIHGVQPVAPVARVHHIGSYNCRTIRGSRRLSQHATGNAVDIVGFTLVDGQRLSLLRDWDPEHSPDARILRRIQGASCDWFNLVLSPDYNELHRDHFHFDMGRYRSCR